MTWVKFHNSAVQRYHSDEYMPADYWIEPSSEGVAQVTEAVAESLVENNIADYHNK